MDRLEVPRPPGRGCLGSCSRLSGAIVYFVADPERIKRGEASDLRWECAGDVPYVQLRS